MVKFWTICTNFNLQDLFQYIILYSILLFFVTQPVIEITLNLVEYELCETHEDDDVEEKEELKEEQKKEPNFYTPKKTTYIFSTSIGTTSTTEIILFPQLNYSREFYLEILLPPPEQV